MKIKDMTAEEISSIDIEGMSVDEKLRLLGQIEDEMDHIETQAVMDLTPEQREITQRLVRKEITIDQFEDLMTATRAPKQ